MVRRTSYTALLTLAALCAALTACGSHESPTAPSASITPESTPAPAPSTAGATISGTVTLAEAGGGGTPGVAGPRAVSDLTVSVVGTALSAGVDAAGRFRIANVAPGDARLRFSGPGVDATITVGGLQASQTLSIAVTVSGQTATLGDDPRGGTTETRVTGTIAAMSGSAPGATLTVAGRTVRTNASTVVRRRGDVVGFDQLRVGLPVEVEGLSQADGGVLASKIGIEDAATPAPEVQAEFTGTLTALSGSAPGATLTVAGRAVRTNASTVVRRSGNVVAFSTLAPGQTVEVNGTTQADGSVLAARLTIENEATPTPSVEAEFTGTLTALSGSAPGATLTVAGRAVRTNAGTVVRRSGDAVAFSTLATGQTIEVKGTTQADGSVLASRLTIEDGARAPEPVEAEFTGTLTALSGSTPGATLTVAGRTVRTSAGTVVRRSGNVVAFSTLATGQTIEVKGATQADGSVAATRLTIEDLGGTPAPVEAEVEGTLASLAGNASAATLVIDGRTVRTTAATRIDGPSGTSGFAVLKVGQRVRARGTVQADNAILASRVETR